MIPENTTPAPRPAATTVLLVGLAITTVASNGETPVELAREYAIGAAASILASVAVDYRKSIRSLVRADLMAIASLYFLTLFEFLLPQHEFNNLVTLEEARPALEACLLGYAGLALGRHFAPQPQRSLHGVLRQDISPKTLLILYTLCFVGGYFYMLLAVNFDVGLMLDYFMAPRFSQPWGRGKFGDWKALLGELGMVIYLVSPIAGIVLARRKDYTKGQNIYVAVTFLFTLFYGFTSGTRNIFVTFLATFLVAFAFAVDPKRKKELFVVVPLVCLLTLVATVHMLEFRTIGFRRYVEGYREYRAVRGETSFYVDYNLFVIAKLVSLFPSHHPHLGFEIPYLAIIRPIPRALWSSKPEGLSISMEDALGVEGLTVASSFVGEAYISAGFLGVLITGLIFGAITGWWNRLGHIDNSPFGHLVFASGFFAAVISMRSMFVFTTAILPTIAALIVGNWLIGGKIRRRAVQARPSE